MSLEKFLANNLALSDAEDNTSRPLNRVGSFVLLAYESLAASRNLLQWSLGCMNLTFDSEDLFCWYKQKKLCIWTMAAAQAAENYGDK